MSSSISRNLQCHSGLLCSAFVMASPCTDPVSCILYPWPCQTNRSARWYSYPKTLFSNWPQSDICWFFVSLCCIINRKLGRLNKERVSITLSTCFHSPEDQRCRWARKAPCWDRSSSTPPTPQTSTWCSWHNPPHTPPPPWMPPTVAL